MTSASGLDHRSTAVGCRAFKPRVDSTDNGVVPLVLIVCLAVALWLAVVLMVAGLCRQAARGDRANRDLRGAVRDGPARDAPARAEPERSIPHGRIRRSGNPRRAGVR